MGSTPEQAREARQGLLTFLGIDEPVFSPEEKAQLESAITIEPLNVERDESDDEETDLLLENNDKLEDLTCTIIRPCKVPLQIRGKKGIIKNIQAYVDSGAPASFVAPEAMEGLEKLTTHEATKSYWGAIQGIPQSLAEVYMKPPEADGFMKMYVYVAKSWSQAHKEAFGDMILGTPALATMKLDMGFRENEYILKYNSYGGVEQRISINNQATKLTSKPVGSVIETNPFVAHAELIPVAATIESDPYITVNPTEAEWDKKLNSCVNRKLRRLLKKLLVKYNKRFYVSGYLPPVKDVIYRIEYKGPSFRQAPIPLPLETRKEVMKQMREQLKYGLIGEVPPDKIHLLKYVSATFVKHETDKIRVLINYTTLNKGTVKVDFPLPNKEDLIAKITGGHYYIAMDAKAAYNQVWICKSCRDYMTFIVLDEGNKPR